MDGFRRAEDNRCGGVCSERNKNEKGGGEELVRDRIQLTVLNVV